MYSTTALPTTENWVNPPRAGGKYARRTYLGLPG